MHLAIAAFMAAVPCGGAPTTSETPYREPLRPQFHFTAAAGWLNDPNGLVYYRGEYHLCFQHNPKGTEWGNMTWGHAVSPDLFHWRQLDHAILPDESGTIFSGSAVVDVNNTAGFQKGGEKTLVALYTAAGGTSPESKGRPFTQCLAYSNDRGRTWTKYENNPVLAHIVKENRDPKVTWHAPTKRWVMALYKDGSEFALFSSPDLKQWTHLQDIRMQGHSECPDIFEMPVEGEAKETRWVFTAADGYYLVGAFDGARFSPEAGPLQADWGGNYYAVQTYSDAPDGRRIQIAWMRGGEYPGMPFNQQMSVPCELRLRRFREGLRLTRLPVREIETLRGRRHHWSDVTLSEGENPLAGVSGELFDIAVTFEATSARKVSLSIHGEPITWSPADNTLTCLGRAAKVEPMDDRVTLRILVDRTSMELFANDGRVVMTSYFLPKPENRGLSLDVEGGRVQTPSLTVHELRSAWQARTGS